MIIKGDCLEKLKDLPDNSVDMICTDPPYALKFMGKSWDAVLPDIEIWKECLRVLKPGAFAFIMAAPRQDVLSRMIVNISDAGFKTDFTSMYWTTATGFPKALDIKKSLEKRYEKTKSQLCEMWKTTLHETISSEESNNRWIMQELLEDMEQGKQYEIYAYTGSEGGLPESTSKRQKQSCLERWGNLQTEKRKLWECEVCKMPTGIYIHGKKRWVCYGTSFNNGTMDWEVIDENGVCSSYKSQYRNKQKGKPFIICNKCLSQKVRALDGSKGGFQPKPSVEVVLVAMKPCEKNTYTDQALDNGKGITWLDDCRVPYADDGDLSTTKVGFGNQNNKSQIYELGHKSIQQGDMGKQGRFPANLLVSDDILKHESKGAIAPVKSGQKGFGGEIYGKYKTAGDDGKTFYSDKETSTSYSRFFSLDAWAELHVENLEEVVQRNLPFLIVPKASKKEKNAGCDRLEDKPSPNHQQQLGEGGFVVSTGNVVGHYKPFVKNNHPTVKPIKLMSYLITLGSREGDVVLDPFAGSGSTGIAAVNLFRKYIMIEMDDNYYEICKARIEYAEEQLGIFKEEE